MHIDQPPLRQITPLKPGIYKHYKGGFYKVLGVARNENTQEEVVVYRSISRGLENGEGPLWVRPIDQFAELVDAKEKRVQRYTYVSEK